MNEDSILNELVSEAKRSVYLGKPWAEILSHGYEFHASGARRRTNEQMEAIDAAICKVVHEYPVITVRQLYYQLVSRGVIPKTEQAYKNLAVRRSGVLRKEGILPYRRFADATRWQRKPDTHEGVKSALNRFAGSFRRDLWADTDHYVEIWCEKDALAGVIYDVTDKYDVPLMVSRGYSSLSFLHSAAETILDMDAEGKSVHLYHFGDWDPSGQDAARVIRETLEEMTYVDFEFVNAAVTEQQITDMKLPQRPTKKTDTRAKNWSGGSVELDAIDPSTLCNLVEECILSHVDERELAQVRKIEEAERETLEELSGIFSKRTAAKVQQKMEAA